jgi:hypothetical protein
MTSGVYPGGDYAGLRLNPKMAVDMANSIIHRADSD